MNNQRMDFISMRVLSQFWSSNDKLSVLKCMNNNFSKTVNLEFKQINKKLFLILYL